MTGPFAGVEPPPAEARRLQWSWWWLLVELMTIAALLMGSLLVGSLRPGASSDVVEWTALGVAGVVAVVGAIVGFGFFLYASPIWPAFEVSSVRSWRSPETLWSQLSRQERRGLRRMLRRGQGAAVSGQHRLAAAWFAARSIRHGVPQATGQTGIGALWMAMSVSDAVGTGRWWLHVAAGLLLAVNGVVVCWLTPRLRRSLTQLEL